MAHANKKSRAHFCLLIVLKHIFGYLEFIVSSSTTPLCACEWLQFRRARFGTFRQTHRSQRTDKLGCNEVFWALKSIALVRRSFRQQFCPRKPRGVPRPNAFHRLIERFEREGATWPSVPSGAVQRQMKKWRSKFSSRKILQPMSDRLLSKWRWLPERSGKPFAEIFVGDHTAPIWLQPWHPRTKHRGFRPAGSGCSMQKTGSRGCSGRMRSGSFWRRRRTGKTKSSGVRPTPTRSYRARTLTVKRRWRGLA